MGHSKYGLKFKLNAINMRIIKSLRGIYAENSQDGKYAELDRFVEAYRLRAPEISAEAGYVAQGGGNQCDTVEEVCQS